MRRIASLAFFLVLLAVTTVAQQTDPSMNHGGKAKFVLTSTAFAQGAEIPAEFTCKGADTSPALEWQGAPAQVAVFALITDDPDAPDGTWVHWVAWNLPPSAHSLPADVPKQPELNDGTRQGRNDFQRVGYSGPCPPPGKPHRYFFRLYALNRKVELAPGATRAELDAAIKNYIVAEAEYMGTFHR
jgi:Raf kinase inhibitor-like YbhB/YbcL family protein